MRPGRPTGDRGRWTGQGPGPWLCHAVVVQLRTEPLPPQLPRLFTAGSHCAHLEELLLELNESKRKVPDNSASRRYLQMDELNVSGN